MTDTPAVDDPAVARACVKYLFAVANTAAPPPLPPVMTVSQEPPHEMLTAREYQIFYKLGQGEGVNKIAGELCVSLKTVHTYRSRVLKKMKMFCDADIIRYAVEKSLFD